MSQIYLHVLLGVAALVINTTNANMHKANVIILSLWLPQNFELWLNYLKSRRNDNEDPEWQHRLFGFWTRDPWASTSGRVSHTRELTYCDRVITSCPTWSTYSIQSRVLSPRVPLVPSPICGLSFVSKPPFNWDIYKPNMHSFTV